MIDYANMSDDQLLALYQQEKAKVGSVPGKALPVGLQKDEDADIEALSAAKTITSTLRGIRNQVNDKALRLGPIENTVNQTRNWLGASNEQSRNYSSFRSALEKLRNDSLRLNKGVQTEGDAQRAWNELISNINDPELVRQRLEEIEGLNAKAAQLQEDKITTRRSDRGVSPRDLSAYKVSDEGTMAKPYDLSRGQSRFDIPRGAYYRDPKGNVRRNDNYDRGNPIVRKSDAKAKGAASNLTDDDLRKALGL